MRPQRKSRRSVLLVTEASLSESYFRAGFGVDLHAAERAAADQTRHIESVHDRGSLVGVLRLIDCENPQPYQQPPDVCIRPAVSSCRRRVVAAHHLASLRIVELVESRPVEQRNASE